MKIERAASVLALIALGVSTGFLVGILSIFARRRDERILRQGAGESLGEWRRRG